MSARGKSVMLITAALAFVLGVGYITSWLSLASCADETFKEIQHHGGITGIDLAGNKVALTRGEGKVDITIGGQPVATVLSAGTADESVADRGRRQVVHSLSGCTFR